MDAEDTGLADGWTDALLDTYKAGPVVHDPGRVLADVVLTLRERSNIPLRGGNVQ